MQFSNKRFVYSELSWTFYCERSANNNINDRRFKPKLVWAGIQAGKKFVRRPVSQTTMLLLLICGKRRYCITITCNYKSNKTGIIKHKNRKLKTTYQLFFLVTMRTIKHGSNLQKRACTHIYIFMMDLEAMKRMRKRQIKHIINATG